MIAGHNNDQCLADVKYNLTEEQCFKIVSTKKAMKSELDRMTREEKETGVKNPQKASTNFMLQNFDKVVLPSIYNNVGGYETQTSFHKGPDGEPSETLKDVSRAMDVIAQGAKYEEGSILDKTITSMYNQYKDVTIEAPTEKEMKKQMEEKEPKGGSGHKPPEGPENPLQALSAYKQLEEWFESIKTSDATKKKFQPISKMSDLQKVSAIEFVKPRGLLMKKIVNRELYCKQSVPADRFMNTIIDFSPSMSSFNKWRNLLLERIYEDCEKMNITFENTFWDTNLYPGGSYGPQTIKSKKDLKEKVLDSFPRGNGTDMETSTIQKLQLLKKTKAKQYLLVISDGDGSIDRNAAMIYKLCAEKNIDIKFALFTDDSTMNGIKKSDIFQIFQNGDNNENNKSTPFSWTIG